VVSFTTKKRSTRCPVDRRLSASQRQSGHCRKKKHIADTGNQTLAIQPVAIPTELSWLIHTRPCFSACGLNRLFILLRKARYTCKSWIICLTAGGVRRPNENHLLCRRNRKVTQNKSGERELKKKRLMSDEMRFM
jgi:hypothetical protein